MHVMCHMPLCGRHAVDACKAGEGKCVFFLLLKHRLESKTKRVLEKKYHITTVLLILPGSSYCILFASQKSSSRFN